MKRLQPLFQLLTLLVLHGTGMASGANLGRFGVGNPNLNSQDRQCYLTNGAIGNPGRVQSLGLMASGLGQALNLGNGTRLLDPVVLQLVGTANVVDATGIAYLSARLEAGLSIIALRFSDLPSIELSKPRLNGGGSRRLYAAST